MERFNVLFLRACTHHLQKSILARDALSNSQALLADGRKKRPIHATPEPDAGSRGRCKPVLRQETKDPWGGEFRHVGLCKSDVIGEDLDETPFSARHSASDRLLIPLSVVRCIFRQRQGSTRQHLSFHAMN